MGFRIDVEEEYGYRRYAVIVENMTVEEFTEFCSKTNAENYFFHSFGLFHTMKRIKPEVELKVLEIEFGEHPLYGWGMYVLKDEHADNETEFEIETHAGFFHPFKHGTCEVYMHMHMEDDSYIQIGEKYFSFAKGEDAEEGEET